MKTADKMELLFDGNRGIYIPQLFAKQCNPENSYWVWNHQEHKDDLSNPENEFYWETWQTVMDEAYYLNPDNGKKYVLCEDEGNLWAVLEGYVVEEW